MRPRPARCLAAGLACATVGSLALTGAASAPAAPGSASAPGQAAQSTAGEPGPFNAITDVPGIEVGQVQKTRPPYLTGSTVVRTPTMPVAGVDQSGGNPATWMTNALSPLNANPGVDAIVLTGGSIWGMDVGIGAMHWVEDHGVEGPIVPGAGIFDIGRGGDERARPTASWGYRATAKARGGPVRQGTAGGGTGATSGGLASPVLKGGVGTASVELGDGLVVGALVVVNSLGSTVNPKDCTLLGTAFGIGGEFAGLRKPSRAECSRTTGGAAKGSKYQATNKTENRAKTKPARQKGKNTTIAVVATNTSMENAAITKVAGVANDGLARAIIPSHTLYDGDTVFAAATGKGRKLANNDPNDVATLTRIQDAAANSLSRAVAHAMLSATSAREFKSYCDTYPSACENLRRNGTGKKRAG
ncbi:P1 family peptidase [Streptomyces coffeae]|uniref:P1 family peptidase n=1 Tax=Streptomyces coffeae TaxID=621382 RepID=A0ABS1NP16_9ACTN|nr:P1 family peptidase [Streptomyces coffeae]MBL1101823.1 P1 family peptidase [Streptomyces coffeae]